MAKVYEGVEYERSTRLLEIIDRIETAFSTGALCLVLNDTIVTRAGEHEYKCTYIRGNEVCLNIVSNVPLSLAVVDPRYTKPKFVSTVIIALQEGNEGTV